MTKPHRGAYLANELPPTLRVHCENCNWTGPAKDLDPAVDIWNRVGVGADYPAGECPECGGLAYVDDDEWAARPSTEPLTQGEVWNSNQSWHWRRLWSCGRHKLMVRIERNAYAFQSWLRVDILTPDADEPTWELLVRWPLTDARRSSTISYVRSSAAQARAAFEGDEEDLLREAVLLLEVSP